MKPEPQGGDTRSRRIEAHPPVILKAVETTPDITLAELRELLAGRGVAVAASTLHRFFARRRITLKKSQPMQRSRSVPMFLRGVVRGSRANWTSNPPA